VRGVMPYRLGAPERLCMMARSKHRGYSATPPSRSYCNLLSRLTSIILGSLPCPLTLPLVHAVAVDDYGVIANSLLQS
jgi:hypothetical protein